MLTTRQKNWLKIHASGGLSGIRDIGLIDSAIEHIKNDVYYPILLNKVVHLIFSINKGHAFNDGNKRTSLSAAVILLLKNGWQGESIGGFIQFMEDVVVWVADNVIDKDDLGELVLLIWTKYMGPEYEDYFHKMKSAVATSLSACRVYKKSLELRLPKSIAKVPKKWVINEIRQLDRKILMKEYCVRHL